MFDVISELYLYCFYLVYLLLINEVIDEFVGQWNNYLVIIESNFLFNQLWIEGMLNLWNFGYVVVFNVI